MFASPAKPKFSETSMPTLPLAKISPANIVKSGLCIGCGSCASGQSGARMEFDALGNYRPRGDAVWLLQPTEIFAQTCPFSPAAASETQLALEQFPDAPTRDGRIGSFEAAYVGYVAESDYRLNGSSGGLVSWVADELLKRGLVDGVAHVVPVDDPQADGKFFRYRIARTSHEISQGAKSRYYPVEMSDILAQIRMMPGRYAVVGVPCFIKALQLLRRTDPVLRERIAFTLGLFCGHMKSARFIESFAWQMDVPIEEVSRVEFRRKDPSRAANVYTAQLTLRDGTEVRKDWWNLADGDWGAGFFQNSACNWCDDVVAETADVSFGDAWVEPYSSDGRGTNVVIARSPVVAALLSNAIDEGRLHLENVGTEFIVQTQAAGFRQRREGLSYRLRWPRVGIRPRKRVSPFRLIAPRRKLIYAMRALISAGSHRVFWLARLAKRPQLYIGWARLALGVYHGLAYGRGKVGAWVERIGLRGH